MEIVKLKIADLNQAPYNPRMNLKPGDAEWEHIKNSIQTFGYIDPIIVNQRNNVIVGGHQRYKILKSLGYDEIDCVLVDMDDQQEKACNAALNKAQGDWNFDMLGDLLDSITEFDMTDFGFEIDNNEPVELTEDDVPEVDDEAEPITQTGDIWQLGRHRLMCGDSTDPLNIDLLMQGKKADLVFTDPPYGMKKEADGVANNNLNYDDLLEFNKQWIPLTFEALKDNGSWYCWGIDEPLMDIYSEILKPMKKKKGMEKLTFRNLITWDKGCGQGQRSPDYRMYPIADEKCLFVMLGRQTYGETQADYWEGFEPIRQRLIAIKNRLGLSPGQVCEYAGATTCTHWFSTSQWEFPNEQRWAIMNDTLLSRGRITREEYDQIREEYDQIREEYDQIREEWYSTRAYFDNTHDNMNNVWHFNKTSGEERETAGGHVTPKPIALCSRAIKSSSREGEIVLDVFGGSGSTLIACEQLNRSAYLMELEPKWCDVIVKRWETLTGEKAVLLNESVEV